MNRASLIPEYGPLHGMRVMGTGSLIAMPFAMTMLADFGAEVIQIERPGVGDVFRYFGPIKKFENGQTLSSSWAQDSRNRLSMTLELNLKDEDIKDIFFRLVKNCDVYIENMVWLNKLGIFDEDLLRENPSLVIVHISGYGHEEFGGVPELCNAASYDMIGQAFSGFALFNGYPDRPPLIIKPSLNDYTTAFVAAFGALAAYNYAQKTGKGQIVDVSQYEAMAKFMRDAFTMSSLGICEVQRNGTKAATFQPWDLFVTADNKYVALGAIGEPVYNRFIKAAGFDINKYPYLEAANEKSSMESPLGQELAREIENWCLSHTAKEIEAVMMENKVPCTQINDAKTAMQHPHFLGRDNFVKYKDETTDCEVTAFGVAPKMSETPGQVWRGCPALGQDTDIILETLLGYGKDEIERFRNKGII